MSHLSAHRADPARSTRADFRITFHGTITLLHPLSEPCLNWLDENVATEGWQWFGNPVAGGGLAVEPRYLDTLVEELAEAGFVGEEE